MLEKIKNLKTKGEILQALISISDETELKEYQKALKNIKNELLKMLESLNTNKATKESQESQNISEVIQNTTKELKTQINAD